MNVVAMKNDLYDEMSIAFKQMGEKRFSEFTQKVMPYSVEIFSSLLTQSTMHDVNKEYLMVNRAVNDKNKISWINKEKVEKMGSYSSFDSFRKSQGTMCKVGKFFKKFFEDLNTKEIEIIMENFIMDDDEDSSEFKIVEGEDIRKYYNGKYYGRNTDTLMGSCMKDDYCSKFFDIYTENIDQIKMLTLWNNDSLIGRALLWYDVYFPFLGTKKIFMDRIYGNNDTVRKFKKYAKGNDFVYKKEQAYTNKVSFIYKQEGFIDKLEINLKKFDFDLFPYMDTMTYTDKEGLFCNFSKNSDFFELDDTEGNPGFYTTCCYCGEGLHEDEYFLGDNNEPYCQICFDQNFIICEKCQEVESVNSAYFIEDEDCYVCRDCSDQYIYVDGIGLFSEDSAGYCKKCNNAYLLEDMEEGYCEKCYNEKNNISSATIEEARTTA